MFGAISTQHAHIEAVLTARATKCSHAFYVWSDVIHEEQTDDQLCRGNLVYGIDGILQAKRYGRDEKNVCRLKPQTYEV